MFVTKFICPAGDGRATGPLHSTRQQARRGLRLHSAFSVCLLISLASAAIPQQPPSNPSAISAAHPAPQTPRPPRVVEAEHFLALRGIAPGHRVPPRATVLRSRAQIASRIASAQPSSSATSPATATWQALGPTAVVTPNFGLVTGRVSSLALDPSDATGNRLYIGTTGGGVWSSSNAGTSTTSAIAFSPLTDNLAALGGAAGSSISIGALTVQPGQTGVILAGTGDPNDSLDSYYGAGILRSTDSGNTWELIADTDDTGQQLGSFNSTFVGNGFAGFAWSTLNPQLVVAAVSQALEGELVGSSLVKNNFAGLYYSADSGVTWHLASIIDGPGAFVQGPAHLPPPGGNAATAVVWNAARNLFFAAVRYHGYYQSADGLNWTRMAAQPGGAELSTTICPSRPGAIGSIACPIFRGVLAVNPQSGDTFAWTVDRNGQDQGLWQDQCAISGLSCSNASITFAQQWSTTDLEANTLEGAATIPDGVYNLALAAVPSQQDTLLLAGANDLWKCSLTMGCVWRNTTNSTTCMSAQVGGNQHALAWSPANPLEVFVGNDSGLWRSTDAIGETGSMCSATDASHFQNLNGSLGSLAEVQSLPSVIRSPYTLLAGLGINGTAGVKAGAATTDWPQVLAGYGGPVAINPRFYNDWYINDQAGVAIYLCSLVTPCSPSDFGTSPVVDNADVGGDGDSMPVPAPFLVDPLNASDLLIGTCRMWRGPASSAAWSSANAISPILDSGAAGVSCNGDALIRSIAAALLPNGNEIIYVGMYGSAYNGGNLPGHIFSATFNAITGEPSAWTDLTSNPVVNASEPFNAFGFDISSISIDPHDASDNTLYATVEGMAVFGDEVRIIYRTTDGGATWTDITANLPLAPASSVVVDPQSANTIYISTDAGVFFTTEVANCAKSLLNCWSDFGIGLPGAPVVALSATPLTVSPAMLVAATYGRGIWQTPLFTSATAITAAAAAPSNVAFSQTPAVGVASQPIQVQLFNTGNLPLAVFPISMLGDHSGDFSETDNCQSPPVSAIPVGGSCTINVTFTPQMATLERTAVMTIYGNLYGGQLTVNLTGTGTAASGSVTLSPNPIAFDPAPVGSTSVAQAVTVSNGGTNPLSIASVAITAPFLISTNSCGPSVAAKSACALGVEFSPKQAGPANGLLTVTDADGVQTVNLSGTGEAQPTDVLNPASLTFAATPDGQLSTAQSVTITNLGDLPLTSSSITASPQFVPTPNFTTQIAAHSIGTIGVQFAPTQVGPVSGTLIITDLLQSQTVTLSGTGIAAPTFSVNPASLTFTNQQPGVPSAPQSIIITNSGGSSMANICFAITGPAASSYSLVSATCDAALGNGSSFTVQVVFTPNATGVISAALNISSSTSGVTPVSVPLNGSGQLSTGLTASPSQINFPVLGAGQSSAAQIVTVTNSTGYSIASLALATAAPFSVTQNTCTGSLAAGANCTASVVFQPAAAGSSTGVLTVTSTAVATPVTVALAGVGFDFALTASGPTTQTVAAGQQANYTLVLTPSGSKGDFTFTCGTPPTNAFCLFNPATESLNAGVQGDFEVQISTGSTTTVRLDSPPAHPGPWRAAPLACVLLLLPLAFTKRRKLLLFAVLAVLLIGEVASCTSSGGGTGRTGGNGNGSTTPPGTYTIPVTVTSTGVSHAINLSLTVD
jgi:hypothetical protein